MYLSSIFQTKRKKNDLKLINKNLHRYLYLDILRLIVVKELKLKEI
mgnify:CR=1 FL=1